MIRDKKILVTGATGGVATAIAKSLVKCNEVWGAARFTNLAKRHELEDLGVRTFAWTLGDDVFEGLPTDFDYVIHSAATIFPVAHDYDAAIRENAEGTGLLMSHTRNAKALLYVSSLQVYADVDDRSRGRTEDEPLGSHPTYAPSYGISKVATEAVVRTLARIYSLPTTIGRLGANFGIDCPGIADATFKEMLSGRPMVVPPRGKSYVALVYNTDIINQLEPLLGAASVPATIVNWCGDEGVEYRKLIDYMSELSGIVPTYVEDPNSGPVAGFGDVQKRIGITGPGTDWRSAIRETLRHNHPGVKIR